MRISGGVALVVALAGCGEQQATPPSASVASSAAGAAAASSASAVSTVSTAAPPSVPSSAPSAKEVPATPIAAIKSAAAAKISDYMGKPIELDGLFVRKTVRVQGGPPSEHIMYRSSVVIVRDVGGPETINCEAAEGTPVPDLKENDPVTIKGRGMANAGTSVGYLLYVNGCTVTKR